MHGGSSGRCTVESLAAGLHHPRTWMDTAGGVARILEKEGQNVR